MMIAYMGPPINLIRVVHSVCDLSTTVLVLLPRLHAYAVSELPLQLPILPRKRPILFRPNLLLSTPEWRRADSLRRPEIPRCLIDVILPLQVPSGGYMWLQELLEISVPPYKRAHPPLDGAVEALTSLILLIMPPLRFPRHLPLLAGDRRYARLQS